MGNSPYLLMLMAIPLVGSIATFVISRDRYSEETGKRVALGTSVITLVIGLVMFAVFNRDGARLQFVFSVDWIKALGVKFALGADGIALVLIVLTTLLVPIVMVASWTRESLGDQVNAPGAESEPDTAKRGVARMFAWILLLEVFMVGVFAATDVFLFYVFFEVMLIPMYFIIGGYGASRRRAAAMKFFLYSLLGGLVMLAGVIGLYVASVKQLGTGTFSWDTLRQLDLSEGTQIWLFLSFFVAFAIKAPLVPFHTWLPTAGAEAPIGAGVLLVGIMDKVGTFGFLRYNLPLFPDASKTLAPYVLVLCVLGVVYGAFQAIGQKDMKRFVSYTSIAHFGFIGLGVFVFTTQAGSGAVLYMVNHGISTGLLFLVVGMVVARGGSRKISDYGGVFKLAPVLGGVFLVAGLASLALPGTNSFVSEFLVLLGSFGTQPVFSIIATVGIIFAALYVLWVYQRTMHGPVSAYVSARSKAFKDLRKREIGVLAPLLLLVLLLGLYPKPVLDVINPAVEATLQQDVGVQDPAPNPQELSTAPADNGGSK